MHPICFHNQGPILNPCDPYRQPIWGPSKSYLLNVGKGTSGARIGEPKWDLFGPIYTTDLVLNNVKFQNPQQHFWFYNIWNNECPLHTANCGSLDLPTCLFFCAEYTFVRLTSCMYYVNKTINNIKICGYIDIFLQYNAEN